MTSPLALAYDLERIELNCPRCGRPMELVDRQRGRAVYRCAPHGKHALRYEAEIPEDAGAAERLA